MTREDDEQAPEPPNPRPPYPPDDRRDIPDGEGVRIIGPEEADEALNRGEAQGRRSHQEPRRGGRPVAPPQDRPPPALRFPLDASAELDEFEPPPPAAVDDDRESAEIPHWAETAPEEVPNMSPRDPYEGYEGDDPNAWSAFPGPGPRWSDDAPAEGYGQPPPNRSVFDQPPGPPRQGRPPEAYPEDRDTLYDQPTYAAPGPASGQSYVDDDYDDSYADSYRDSRVTAPHGAAVPPPPPEQPRRKPRPTAAPRDRDLRVAVGVALGLAATALILFQLGPPATMVLVVAVLGLASLEYFTATQRAGFDPLTPVGLTATVGILIAAYHYGEVALPLVIVLTVAVCLVWYLIGAGGDHPMRNIGATLVGVCWVGLFGAYAALLLAAPNGIALLLAAVIPTVGYDVGAFFVGRSAGSRPLSPASPNKTIEGLAGGMLLAVVAGVLLGVVGPEPFDGFSHGVLIGLVAAVAAPLGDLSQSLIKRDLRIKDMGTLLPGHGGVLDRFDSLLFVLPAIWYLSVVVDPQFFL